MTKASIHALAAALGLALASAAFAQFRHDEKPHGVPGKGSAAPDTPVTDRTPGRHVDRPHGKAKAKTKKADQKKTEAKKEGAGADAK